MNENNLPSTDRHILNVITEALACINTRTHFQKLALHWVIRAYEKESSSESDYLYMDDPWQNKLVVFCSLEEHKEANTITGGQHHSLPQKFPSCMGTTPLIALYIFLVLVNCLIIWIRKQLQSTTNLGMFCLFGGPCLLFSLSDNPKCNTYPFTLTHWSLCHSDRLSHAESVPPLKWRSFPWSNASHVSLRLLWLCPQSCRFSMSPAQPRGSSQHWNFPFQGHTPKMALVPLWVSAWDSSMLLALRSRQFWGGTWMLP